VIGRGEANSFSARLVQVSYLGEIEQYELQLADGVKLKVFEQNPWTLRQAGATLELHVRPGDLMVIAAEAVA
jgi:hypothetical protein